MSASLEVIAREPAYLIGRYGPVVIVVWRQRVVDAGIDVIERELARLCADHASAATVVVIEDGCVLPTDAQRERLSKMLPRFPAVIADALVFEGRGLQRTIIRSMATMMNLVSPARKRGMEVLGDVESASAWTAKMLASQSAALDSRLLAGAVQELRR